MTEISVVYFEIQLNWPYNVELRNNPGQYNGIHSLPLQIHLPLPLLQSSSEDNSECLNGCLMLISHLKLPSIYLLFGLWTKCGLHILSVLRPSITASLYEAFFWQLDSIMEISLRREFPNPTSPKMNFSIDYLL